MRTAGSALLVVAGLLAGAGLARAQAIYTGAALLQICETNADPLDKRACVGFIAAIADALREARATSGNILGSRACLPAAATEAQTRDAALQYLRAHPEDRPLSAAALVVRALAEAWPCPNQ